MRKNSAPTGIATSETMIGTKREPPKNPSTCGSWMLWYRLCSHTASAPITSAPTMPVSIASRSGSKIFSSEAVDPVMTR